MRACHRHRTHYVMRLSEALVLLYASSLLKFLHLSTGLPYQGLTLFVCSNDVKERAERQSAELHDWRPVRDILVLVVRATGIEPVFSV